MAAQGYEFYLRVLKVSLTSDEISEEPAARLDKLINHSTSRRGFLRLSRVLPTSRVFTLGYVNTETILHFFNVTI